MEYRRAKISGGTYFSLIKSYFSRNCHDRYHGKRSRSRESKQEQAIWQRRFWEHFIDSEEDLNRHVDYIHYNPVRHGLVTCVHQWQYSSFHREVKRGGYPANWGCECDGNKFESVQSILLENLELK